MNVGYLILISIAFYDFNSPFIFPLVLVSIEKIYQTLKLCLTTFPNTSKCIKHTPLRVVFSNEAKHGLSCLIYYIQVFVSLQIRGPNKHCVYCYIALSVKPQGNEWNFTLSLF